MQKAGRRSLANDHGTESKPITDCLNEEEKRHSADHIPIVRTGSTSNEHGV